MFNSRLNDLILLQRKIDKEIDRLVDQWEADRATPDRKRRPRNVKPDCGTESGYQAHRYRGEDCDECREAHAAYERVAAAARRRKAR